MSDQGANGDLGRSDEELHREAAAARPPTSAKKDRGVEVQSAAFQPLSNAGRSSEGTNIEILMDVTLPLSVQLGTSRMTVREILGLVPGSVIELDKAAGEPVDLFVNQKLIARGEVVVIDENFGIRIVDIVNGADDDSR